MNRRRTVLATVSAAALVGAGGAAVVLHLHAPAQRPAASSADPARGTTSTAAGVVYVDAKPVPATPGLTVAAAVRAAGVTLVPGHYIAVLTQRPLTTDGNPARVYVDGRPATPATPLTPGATVTTRPGVDLVEPTVAVMRPLPPAIDSLLYIGSRDGVQRVVIGKLSHEVVSRHVLRPAHLGRLIRPGAVALTFDDGPADRWTQKILALLDKHRVRATFCEIGDQIAHRAWLTRRVVRSGDALCDHTWDHDLQLRSRPRGQMQLDIKRGRRAIERVAGTAPVFFRAPGGNWSPQLMQLARADGMTPLTWTVDTRDWARPGVHAILQAVYRELRPGGVILMHDGGGDRSQTLAALKILLRRLPKLGYHFVLPPPAGAAATPAPSPSTSPSPSPTPTPSATPSAGTRHG